MKKILISASKSQGTDYKEAIELAGGIADIYYLPECKEILGKTNEELIEYLSTEYYGFILSGGGDVNPIRYGEEQNGSTRIDDKRDEWEFCLIKRFMELHKPIMGICRGHQVMNVALGGTLYQDDGKKLNNTHTSLDLTFKNHITYCKSSYLQKLYGNKFIVNSHHHQSIKKLADDLIAIQYSKDWCIEGVIHKTYPYIGVQWHPERLCKGKNYIDGVKIFKYFLSMDKG